MKNLVYILFSLIILFGCAKRGTPTGGPKDSIPPVLVNASPKLNSTNSVSYTHLTLPTTPYV